MLAKNRFHPKNIYKTPPDFKELAIEYPEFRKYVRQELSGRSSIDFQDERAVKELTRTLLKKDFDLNVEIDDKRLIPRVPLCLNYILWIEDLLSLLGNSDSRVGIDIGTGNVCIYSLLAARKGWKMLATEMDSENFKSARHNVDKNNLGGSISVKLNKEPHKLLEGVLDTGVTYDFCMCNPPFYDYSEKPSNRTTRRLLLKPVASGIPSEISTKGGELSFVQQLFKESLALKTQVRIFTTLVGKKCDFLQLKKELQAVNPKSSTFTEFCQGRTTRWAIAWTFLDIELQPAQGTKNKLKKRKTKAPLSFVVPDCRSSNLDEAYEKIHRFLTVLEMTFKDVTDDSDHQVVTFKAVKNTWSHQRRKKRMEARKNDVSKEQREEHEEGSHHAHNSEEDCSSPKKPKLDGFNKEENTNVEGFIMLNKLPESDSLIVEMSWLSGNKESLHQIFQFFKNNWKDPI